MVSVANKYFDKPRQGGNGFGTHGCVDNCRPNFPLNIFEDYIGFSLYLPRERRICSLIGDPCSFSIEENGYARYACSLVSIQVGLLLNIFNVGPFVVTTLLGNCSDGNLKSLVIKLIRRVTFLLVYQEAMIVRTFQNTRTIFLKIRVR